MEHLKDYLVTILCAIATLIVFGLASFTATLAYSTTDILTSKNCDVPRYIEDNQLLYEIVEDTTFCDSYQSEQVLVHLENRRGDEKWTLYIKENAVVSSQFPDTTDNLNIEIYFNEYLDKEFKIYEA